MGAAYNPLYEYGVRLAGWRTVQQFAAVGMAATALPCWLLLKDTPEGAGWLCAPQPTHAQKRAAQLSLACLQTGWWPG